MAYYINCAMFTAPAIRDPNHFVEELISNRVQNTHDLFSKDGIYEIDRQIYRVGLEFNEWKRKKPEDCGRAMEKQIQTRMNEVDYIESKVSEREALLTELEAREQKVRAEEAAQRELVRGLEREVDQVTLGLTAAAEEKKRLVSELKALKAIDTEQEMKLRDLFRQIEESEAAWQKLEEGR